MNFNNTDRADYVAGSLPSSFIHTIWEEYPTYYAGMPTFPTGNDVISKVNSSKYGLWSWFAHGAPNGICTMTDSINTKPRNVVNTVDYIDHDVIETGNALDSLTTLQYPGIVYSIGCDNTPFDDYDPRGWWPGRNLGEGFTVITKAGGPAILGNTRYGYISGSSSLYEKFADLLTLGTNDPESGKSYLHLGVAELVSKQNYTNHYLNYSHNLVGCPETKIWTQVPNLFSNVAVTDGGTSLTVNSSVPDCDISVCSIDGGQSYFQTESGVSSYTFSTSIRPLYVTISKSNYLPYTGITGGNINVDVTFSGKLEITGDVTVSSGVNLTIVPGTTIKVAQGKKIKIYGVLLAEGNANEIISFESPNTNPSPGDWYGIEIYEGAIIDYAIMKHARIAVQFFAGSYGIVKNSEIYDNSLYGIYIKDTTKPFIENCNIHHNGSKGIYVYNSNSSSEWIEIRDNDIHDNSTCGIYLVNSSPFIIGNTVYNQTYGIIAVQNSSPYLGVFGEAGNNYIHNNARGIAASLSNPFLGEEHCTLHGGYNQFTANSSWHVMAVNNSYVMAELNWWGVYPPDDSDFYTSGGSTIDKTPALKSPPTQSMSFALSPEEIQFDLSFLSSEVDAQTSEKNSLHISYFNWPLSRKLVFARDLSLLGYIEECQTICKDIIQTYPDSSLSFFALDILWQSSRNAQANSNNDLGKFREYISELSINKDIYPLYAYAALISTGLEKNKNLPSVCDYVYSQYKDTYIAKTALFKKCMYYYNEEGDIGKAKRVADQLQREYPNSIEAESALSHFDDKINIAIKKQGSSLSQKPVSSNELTGQELSKIPNEYALSSNYPNPFNPATSIEFSLPKESSVNIFIYNSVGQLVKKEIYNSLPAGIHTYVWDGKDYEGISMSSGLYILNFSANSLEEDHETFSNSIKMILIR